MRKKPENFEKEKAAVLNATTDILTYHAPDLRIIWANRAAGDSLGLSPEEVAGHYCYELWGRGGPCPGCPAVKALKSGRPEESETTDKKGDIWFHRAHPVKNDRGEIEGIAVSAVNITGYKRTEEQLKRLEAIINRSPVMVFLWPIEDGWPVEFVSENVEKVLGYRAEEFTSGKVSWPGITHPEDVPRLEAEVAKFLEEGVEEFNQEYRLITRSGGVRWMHDQNKVLLDPKGAPTHIQSIVLDITDRKQAEDELKEKLEELEKMNKLMVGRELKMIELKERIKELESAAKGPQG